MAFELVLELEGVSNPAIQLDRRVASNGEGLPVGGEGVVRNGVVEEVVNFWLRHYGEWAGSAIGVALYYRLELCDMDIWGIGLDSWLWKPCVTRPESFEVGK